MTTAKNQPEIITVTLNPALDRTVYFETFQVGQVNRVQQELSDPGGKGINVAKVIKALGHEVTVTGFLGRENAQTFHDYFDRKKIRDCFIDIAGATRSNIKIVDEKSGQVTEINFPGLACFDEDYVKLKKIITELAVPGQLFVLAGSVPQGVSPSIYRQLIQLLQQLGCKVFLDASGEALAEGIKAKPYAVKPNLSELSQLVGRNLSEKADVLIAIDELLNAGVQQVIVSLGAEGALAADRTKRFLVRPPKIQANSTVGAGDAMVAGILAGEAQGLSLREKVRLGTAAAAASVVKPGTQAGSLPEVKGLLSQVIIEELEGQ